MKPIRVACIVQRYGAEVNGGSELLCRLVAERLTAHCRVEVLTSCALDYVTWSNHYPAGVASAGGVTVRRFPVRQPREIAAFNRLSARVLRAPHDAAEERRWVEQQGPDCPELLSYLKANHEEFDAFLFFTYLYSPTCLGLPLVKQRSVLVPTAHDEPPIYLGIYDEVFRSARRILFCTAEERDFVLRRFLLDDDVGEVVGISVERPALPPEDPEWGELQQRLGASDVLMYAGRIDESKGCRRMIDDFVRYRGERPSCELKLLLLGNAVMTVPEDPSVVVGGFVSEQTKWRALEASRLVLLPSPYESLSLAVLEAWTVGRPVLVNGQCKVLRGQCTRSNGGLWYSSYEEFRACLDRLLGDAGLCAALGAQGQRYVRANYSWRRIETCYMRALEFVAGRAARAQSAE